MFEYAGPKGCPVAKTLQRLDKSSEWENLMVQNLIIGCAAMVACLVIQCVILGGLVDMLLYAESRGLVKTTLVGLTSLLIVSLLVILVGNLLQMALWAGLFLACGEFADFATAFYHSVVNFATLGYGDIVMSDTRRLLGALEAANGVLMFGLTAAFLYSVISRIFERYMKAHFENE
jgi:hypothetical protein